MCIICDYYIDGLLTGEEALQNIYTMIDVIGEEHGKDVTTLVLNAELDDMMLDLNIHMSGLWPGA